MARYSTAHYFLEGLVDLGVEYIFANLGTDHVSLIEEMARWDKEGRRHPEMILCPHEVVAVHMAGGYALATGRGQAVLVHVDAGTANACMAIQNLFRYRLPVMLFAGRAPRTLHGELTGSRDSYVHFVQDPFDIASIVRPYIKWEYSLPSGVVAVRDRLARACGVRVAEFNSIDLNIPQDSPCFAGSDPLPLLETADLGLLLDSDVPFVPRYGKRAGAMKWIQIDIDPLKADFPMWGFATDMRIQGDCATVLNQVLEAVEARADDAYRKRVAERIAGWSGAREVSTKRRAT